MSGAVIVTGAASGIGFACVEMLLARGFNACAIDIAPIPDGAFAGDTDRLLSVPTDVSDPLACADAVAAAVKKFGKIDALIHMAAVHSTRTWREIDADHMNEVLGINVTGAFNMSQAAALEMEKTGGGAICLAMSGSIMVSGLGGHGRGGIAYISSKAAIIGVTRGLARSLAPINIRVNAVSPGSTRTAMTADYSEEAVRHAGAKTLAGRMGEASEIASVALFLISDEAGYIQGQIINVNGGGSLGL
jgi:NAD(P)-dependent dehydrogenase (short-subunit alcohol dehydrogenase family)